MLKHGYIYICFDGKDKLVNLKFEHKDSEYLFVILCLVIIK